MALSCTHYGLADEAYETWGDPAPQSSIAVNLSAPNGTQAGSAGAEMAISISPTRTTWDVFTSSLGNTTVGNIDTQQMTQGSLSWTVTSGNGHFVTSPTDVSAGTTAIFQMGSGDTDVMVTLSYNGTTVSETLHLSAAAVTWQFLRTEGTLSVTVGSALGTTLPLQGSTAITVHADHVTWDVYQGSDGQIAQQNYLTSPASGGIVSLSATPDGQIDYYQPVLDAAGNLSASFTLGASGHSVVSADVSYYQTNNGQAAVELFGVAVDLPTWHFDHYESAVSLEVSGTTSLTAAVTASNWEAWVDDLGNWDYRNMTSGPATGASVSFGIESGDGTFTSADSSSDFNGMAYATFGGNASSSVIVVTASYSTGTSTATLYVPAQAGDNTEPPPNDPPGGPSNDPAPPLAWTFSYSNASLDAGVSGGLVCGVYHTWDVYTNNIDSSTQIQNQADTQVNEGGAWSVTSGDATVGPDGTLVPGIYDSSATGTISYGGLSATTSVTVAGTGNNTNGDNANGSDPAAEAWSFAYNNASLDASVSGTSVSAVYHTWDVYVSSTDGSTRIQNQVDTVVSGSVNWSISGGDATIGTDGYFVAGINDSSATATVSYAGLSATATVAIPGTGGSGTNVESAWAQTGSDASLDATISGSSVTGTYHTWEIWTNGITGEIQMRNTHDDPVTGGVTWTVTTGDASVSNDGSVTAGVYDSTLSGTFTYQGITLSVSSSVLGTGNGGGGDVNAEEARRAYEKAHRDWEDSIAVLQAEMNEAQAQLAQAQADVDNNIGDLAAANNELQMAQSAAEHAQEEASAAEAAAEEAIAHGAPDVAEKVAHAAGAGAALASALGTVVELGHIVYSLVEAGIMQCADLVSKRSKAINTMTKYEGRLGDEPYYTGPGH